MRSLPGRPQPAPTTGTTQRVPVMVTSLLSAPEARTGGVPRGRPGRGVTRRLLAVGGTLVAGVLAAAVLAGAMSDAVTSRAVAQEARAESALVAAQVEAGRTEIGFAATPAFLGFQARSFGYGRSSERAFALASGAPAPPVIQPLGASTRSAPTPDAVDSVLELLFDR